MRMPNDGHPKQENIPANIEPEKPLAERFEKVIAPTVKDERVRRELTKQVVSVALEMTASAGPIPPAREFAAYNEAVPGAGERILAMAERDQAHFIQAQTEERALKAWLAKSGMVCSLIFLTLVLGTVIWLTYLGAQVVAGVFGGAAIVLGGIGLYLKAHKQEAQPPQPQPQETGKKPTKTQQRKPRG